MRKGQTSSTASLGCSAELHSVRASQAGDGAWADSFDVQMWPVPSAGGLGAAHLSPHCI